MSDWFWKRLDLFFGWAAVAVLFGLIVFAANIEIKDVDLWLHLATGKYILSHWTIPTVDIHSATIANQVWINHEWLFQAVLYFFYNQFGVEGLINLQVCVVVVTFIILIFLGYDRDKMLGPTFYLLLVLLVYQLRFTLRPDIFSILFFTLYVHILAMHCGRKGSLWKLFILQVLWTNIHGFFIIGPLLICVTLLGEWIKRKVRLPFEWNQVSRLSDKEFLWLKWTLLATCAACFLNPHFIRGAVYPLGVFSTISGESKQFFEIIWELRPPIQWHNLLNINHFLAFKLLIILSGLSFILNRRRCDIGLLLFWGVFLALSLQASRNVAFFAIAAYFVLLVNVPQISFKEIFNFRKNHSRLLPGGFIVGNIILIVWMMNYAQALSLRGYFDYDHFERKSEYGGISLRNYPYRAADFLVKNNIEGRFFNDFNSGAYLLGRTSPDIKVFIDGRTEVYGIEFFNYYNKIWEGNEELFKEAAEKYNLTGAFLSSIYKPVPPELIKHLYANKDWVLVYFEYDAVIFLKDIPQNQSWIKSDRINLSKWKTKEVDLLKWGVRYVKPYRHYNRAKALFNLGFFEKSLKESQEALRIAPYYIPPYKLIGEIYMEKEDFEKSFEILRQAVIMDPRDEKIRYDLAFSLFKIDALEESQYQCERILEKNSTYSSCLDLLGKINER